MRAIRAMSMLRSRMFIGIITGFPLGLIICCVELAAERPSLSFTTVTITEFADSGMEPSLRVFDSYGEVHFTISSSSFIPCSISRSSSASSARRPNGPRSSARPDGLGQARSSGRQTFTDNAYPGRWPGLKNGGPTGLNHSAHGATSFDGPTGQDSAN